MNTQKNGVWLQNGMFSSDGDAIFGLPTRTVIVCLFWGKIEALWRDKQKDLCQMFVKTVEINQITAPGGHNLQIFLFT